MSSIDLTQRGERLTQKNESRVSGISLGGAAAATLPASLSMTLLLLLQGWKDSAGGQQGVRASGRPGHNLPIILEGGGWPAHCEFQKSHGGTS